MSKAAYKAHVQELVEYLRCKLFLQEYSYHVHFDACMESDNPGCVAQIQSDTTYLNFTIALAPRVYEFYENGQSRTLCETIVHELCHVLTEPLYLIAIDAVSNNTVHFLNETKERQTQRITNIVMAGLDEKLYKIRRSKR